MKSKTMFVLMIVGALTLCLAVSQPAIAGKPTADDAKVAGDIVGVIDVCAGGLNNVEIYIPGTSNGSRPTASGVFRISYVQPGFYNLIVIRDGQKIGTLNEVEVISRQANDIGTLEICNDMDGDGFNESTDCNDNNPNINPSAEEICGDGIDNDCDEEIDEGCQVCTDNDGDGYYAQSGCGTGIDCDDSDSSINPDATELCDGEDNDCDGLTDDEDPNVDGTVAYYLDSDGDSYGDYENVFYSCEPPAGYTDNANDCDDGNSSIHPGASEVCDDEIDNDCDGVVNELCGDNSITFTGSGSFTVPEEVYEITVEIWGAGGGGGGGHAEVLLHCNGTGGGGGGAGGYTSVQLSVVPGQTYGCNIGGGGSGGEGSSLGASVGDNGGASIFSGPAGTYSADGGEGGQGAECENSGAGGNGGCGTTSCGANGASGNDCDGGAGGSGNGSGGNGGDCEYNLSGQAGENGLIVISW